MFLLHMGKHIIQTEPLVALFSMIFLFIFKRHLNGIFWWKKNILTKSKVSVTTPYQTTFYFKNKTKTKKQEILLLNISTTLLCPLQSPAPNNRVWSAAKKYLPGSTPQRSGEAKSRKKSIWAKLVSNINTCSHKCNIRTCVANVRTSYVIYLIEGSIIYIAKMLQPLS